MSSAKTDELRERLQKLEKNQTIEVQVVPPDYGTLYAMLKVALDCNCYTFLQKTNLFIKKLTPVDETDYPGLAFAVPTYGDLKTFNESTAASPAINDPRNELYTLYDRTTPRDVMDLAVKESKKEWVVFTHHDVYIPKIWGPRFWNEIKRAEKQFGPLGAVGIFGVSGDRRTLRVEAGAVLDQCGTRTLYGGKLPAQVRVLDGCLIAVRRDSGILPNPALGWHFYDADMCMQAEERKLAVVAVESWLLHRSNWSAPDEKFAVSKEIFRQRWANHLPVEVPCDLVS